VDDVLTSGATFLRARSALLEAGVERVYGAFIAMKREALGPFAD
jgi:predicted amidophosphoribosyltransferase